MGSEAGVEASKFLELPDYGTSELFNELEKTALEYADCMTLSDRDVSDSLFEQLKQFFSPDEIVELTATIAWENCSSKFNRALRVDSQNLWQCES